jgi:hypothetical protein
MKQLPIGISTFEKIRSDNYAYVDKTQHIARLATTGGRYYFLSRPRRFGKSLLIDTIKQAFLGRKDLFSGLYLESNWDWSKQYPVIHFDFGTSSAGDSKSRWLADVHNTLDLCAINYGIQLEQFDYGVKFGELIRKLHQATQKQVVILIDEYDKPILDNIINQPQAIEMREMLKDLYTYIKTNDAHIKFALLTGVSKFSKVSLFSGLNILNDNAAVMRNRNIQEIKDKGRMGWQKDRQYGQRNSSELNIQRYKRILGDTMQARDLARQKQETIIGCGVLNKMTSLGMPQSYRFT